MHTKDRRLSYWEQESLLSDVDVLVIGAGIVGLTAARIIAESYPARKVRIVESLPIGAAASSRNAGFACFGSVSEIVADINRYGEDEVVQLVSKRRAGLKRLIHTLGAPALDYKQVGGYEIFNDKEHFELHESSISKINKLLGEDLYQVGNTPQQMRFFRNSIFCAGEGHLNTGMMYRALKIAAQRAQVEILCGIKVDKIVEEPNGCIVSLQNVEGHICAKQVIVTTNALAAELLPTLDVNPCRNQILVTEPIKHHGISGTFHLDEGYVYFRDVGDRMLIGGARNKFVEEATGSFGTNDVNINYLLQLLQDDILPDHKDIRVAHSWSGILSGGEDRRPIVRRVDNHTIVAARLGGMGVAIGSLIGEEAATLASE